MERIEASVAVAEAPAAASTDTASVRPADAPNYPESVRPADAPNNPESFRPADAPNNPESFRPADVPNNPELAVPEEEFVELQVAADAQAGAPPLAVNIEQEVSLSSPPDLNSPECPSCWKALRATDKFCCWCGEAQPNRVLPFLKLCLECSTFLPEKANYCYSCGTDVGYSSRRKVRVPHELFKDEESEFFPRFDA